MTNAPQISERLARDAVADREAWVARERDAWAASDRLRAGKAAPRARLSVLTRLLVSLRIAPTSTRVCTDSDSGSTRRTPPKIHGTSDGDTTAET
jgi:hypothetical protein